MDHEQILAAIVTGLDLLAPVMPGVGGTIVRGIAAGVGLVGDLIGLGMNAAVEIHEIRSSIKDFAGAKARLEQKLRDKFPHG